MLTHARTLRFTGLLFGLAIFAAAGCGKDEGSSAVATSEPVPALAKAAPDDSKPDDKRDVAPQATATGLSERDDAIGDAAPPSGGDDEDEQADEPQRRGAGKSKKKRGRSKKDAPRNRASSSSEEVREAPAAEPKASLRLKRIQFASSIESREPVEPEETFSAAQTEKLYAFLELANESKAESKITVTFIPPIGAHSKVTLKVGDKIRWRTWAQRKSPKAIGTWKVVVHDESGRELGHRSFEVTE
ncbi:MAG: DUF2914 domain-containing protein [Polyangiaceae bacterium]|nr:DUF2914 domain-containing protein [Polyangiaceae bacterium]MBK8938603.1 DUF2914 domain-containing protein [Polyangiaceae bacterium]